MRQYTRILGQVPQQSLEAATRYRPLPSNRKNHTVIRGGEEPGPGGQGAREPGSQGARLVSTGGRPSPSLSSTRTSSGSSPAGHFPSLRLGFWQLLHPPARGLEARPGNEVNKPSQEPLVGRWGLGNQESCKRKEKSGQSGDPQAGSPIPPTPSERGSSWPPGRTWRPAAPPFGSSPGILLPILCLLTDHPKHH